MTSLIEVLDKMDNVRNKETETIAFRGPFIGVLSYSRTDNSRDCVNFYRRGYDRMIFQEIFTANETEVVNESPLTFKLNSIYRVAQSCFK